MVDFARSDLVRRSLGDHSRPPDRGTTRGATGGHWRLSLYNYAGSVDIAADVVGYYTTLAPVPPAAPDEVFTYAYINSNGSVSKGKDVAFTVTRPFVGAYCLRFGGDVSAFHPVANPDYSNGATSDVSDVQSIVEVASGGGTGCPGTATEGYIGVLTHIQSSTGDVVLAAQPFFFHLLAP